MTVDIDTVATPHVCGYAVRHRTIVTHRTLTTEYRNVYQSRVVTTNTLKVVMIMSKSTKNALATVNNNAKSNTTATDVMMTLTDTTTAIQNAVIGTKCKVFTDSKFYVGFGVKCNGFSVNVKKSKYNVYCNDTTANVVENIDGVTVVRNGNATDKTRPHYIELKSTALLMNCINAVLDNVYRVATDTN